MKICLDDKVIDAANYLPEDILLGLFIRIGGNYGESLERMISHRDLTQSDEGLSVTGRFSDDLDIILSKSDKAKPKDARIDRLVVLLQEVFPKGKKDVGYGSNYYWRGNKVEISHKIRKLFLLNPEVKSYSDDEIVDAAKRYVNSFNGNYVYMRLLKYFILREDGGEIISDLMTYLENDDETLLSNEWTQQLI